MQVLKKLTSFPHLLSKVMTYYYSFGTPSTIAIRDLVNETNLFKSKHPDKNPDEMTAWRYYYKNLDMSYYGYLSNKRQLFYFELDYCKVNSEWNEFYTPLLNTALEWCLRERKKKELHRFIKTYYTYDGGTPSARCIKKVIFLCSVLPDKSLSQILKKTKTTIYSKHLNIHS